MRLALCLSGHCRSFEGVQLIVRLLLRRYTCDVFVSTYDSEPLEDIRRIFGVNLVSLNVIPPGEKLLEVELSTYKCQVVDLVYTFCPRPLVLTPEECRPTDDLVDRFDQHITAAAMAQFRGIWDAARLCREHCEKSGVNYDACLRLRLDGGAFAAPGTRLKLPKEEGVVCVNWLQSYSGSLKVNDHFFMAKPRTFFTLTDMYRELPDLVAFLTAEQWVIPASGYQESLWLAHIVRKGFTVLSADSLWSLKYPFQLDNIDSQYVRRMFFS